MSIDIFSGSLTDKQQSWIENRNKTVIEFEDGTLSSFSWTDDITPQKLIDAGLKQSTDAAVSSWITSPTKINIGNTITALQNNLFHYCSSVRSVVFPNTMKKLGQSAFNGCSSLNSIGISRDISSMGTWVFSGCCNVRSVVVDDKNPYFYSTDNMLIDVNAKELVVGVGNGHLVIPDEVSSIGFGVFKQQQGLTSLLIPSNVLNINTMAFSGCSNLKDVTFYNGVSSIGAMSFENCVNLSVVMLPDTINDILTKGFFGCTNLLSVTIGNGVDRIRLSAFGNCPNLKNVVIGSGITQIDNSVFMNDDSISSILFIGKTTAQVKSELTNYNEWGVDASVIHGELD